MSYINEFLSSENFTENFNIIVSNYKNIYKNITNIGHDLKKLENIHSIYISNGNFDMLNHSIYVDDIKHQIEIIKIEFEYMSNIYQKNLNKFYRDLFKLYNKIVRNLMIIYKENKDIIIRIWNNNEKIDGETSEFKKLKKVIKIISDTTKSGGTHASDSKIFEEIKKKHYSKIKLYDEMEMNYIYNMDDVILIYNELELRLTDLNLSKELIKINLLDVKNKTARGILGQTFIMDLNGKIERINIDYKIISKLLGSIMNIHLSISTKYKNLSYTIANSVSYDEDSSSIDKSTMDKSTIDKSTIDNKKCINEKKNNIDIFEDNKMIKEDEKEDENEINNFE
jgi:hypothetical protein